MELQAVRVAPADGRAYQLVVLCHGVGANGQDLIDLAPQWAGTLPHAAWAAPDAPEAYDGAPFGRQWWAIGDRDPARMAAGAAAASTVLDGFIDAELARLGLPADAYALMGFSQGAMIVLFNGLRRACRRAPYWPIPAHWSHPSVWPGSGAMLRRCCWCMARTTAWCRPADPAMRSRPLLQRGYQCAAYMSLGLVTELMTPGSTPVRCSCRKIFAVCDQYVNDGWLGCSQWDGLR